MKEELFAMWEDPTTDFPDILKSDRLEITLVLRGDSGEEVRRRDPGRSRADLTIPALKSPISGAGERAAHTRSRFFRATNCRPLSWGGHASKVAQEPRAARRRF